MANCAHPVGFYLETSFHYEVYKNIIAALQERGIPCALVISDVIQPAFVSEMVSFLKKLARPDLPILRLSTLHYQPVSLSCLVSPYYTPLIKNLAPINVRAMYGLAKDRWGHAWWNAFYDGILCYAMHTQQRVNIAGNARLVGNPRFDDWHNRRWDPSLAEMLARQKTRPVVLYAPTFGELCSLPHWAETLNRLQSEVTLLVKLHHGTQFRAEEAKSLALATRYFRKNMLPASSFSLLAAADYVITDNSGFIFDALHAGKKTILLEWAGLAPLLHNQRTLSDSHSTDQTVRQFLPCVNSLAQLRQALSDRQTWPEMEAYRWQVCDAFQDGKAGERAADVISELLNQSGVDGDHFLLHSLRERLF
ncbi:CDP-glycerol glycerophosphotransferase family protein [Paramixta manurensis]